jgi:hypothetical protein
MVDEVHGEMLPAGFSIGPHPALTGTSVQCRRCLSQIVAENARMTTRNGFTGLKCRRCPDAEYFGTCTVHKNIVGFGEDDMDALEKGDSITCPEPNCQARLTLPAQTSRIS